MAPSARRDEILHVAAELFANKGFKNTTIKDIADAAGVKPASLYHHFDSKEAMVDEILVTFHRDLFGKYHALVESDLDPIEKLVQAIRVSFDATEQQRDAVTIFENEAEYLGERPGFGYLEERNQESRQIWVKLLGEAVETGRFRDDVDVTIAYRFIRDTVWVAPRWHRDADQPSQKEVAENFIRILLNGMVATSQPIRR